MVLLTLGLALPNGPSIKTCHSGLPTGWSYRGILSAQIPFYQINLACVKLTKQPGQYTCACMSIYACKCVYVYNVCTCTYVYICMCAYVCMWVYINMCVPTNVYIWVHLYICVCMYVSVRVYVCAPGKWKDLSYICWSLLQPSVCKAASLYVAYARLGFTVKPGWPLTSDSSAFLKLSLI